MTYSHQNLLCRVWSFSDKTKDTPYIITGTKDNYSCNCPAAKIRKQKNCKHIQQFKHHIEADSFHLPFAKKMFTITNLCKTIHNLSVEVNEEDGLYSS